jgi:hypothetical protein
MGYLQDLNIDYAQWHKIHGEFLYIFHVGRSILQEGPVYCLTVVQFLY